MYRTVECGLRLLSVRQGYVQNCRVWTETAESETGTCTNCRVWTETAECETGICTEK